MKKYIPSSNFWLLTKTAPAIVIGWCLFILAGCKDPNIVDKDLLNGNDANLAKDTLYGKVTNYFEPAVNGTGVNTAIVGSLDDPNFGTTYAGFYAQCQINSNNVSFGTNATLDSAVLSLRYSGSYGKFTTPLDLYVYELNQSILDSVNYLTTDAFQVYTPAIGSISGFLPNTTDSVLVNGETQAPQLRVRLSDNFGNKILHADSNLLLDLTSFLQLFKGFYITTASGTPGNGVVYLDIRSSVSGINLYYHNTDDTALHTFYISATGTTVSHIDNNYTGKPVYTSVNMPNPNGEQVLYVQGGAGTFGKIEFPGILDSLPANIAVNKAELILTQGLADTTYLAPLVLDLFRVDDAGQPQVLPDNSLTYFGGVRLAETVNGVSETRYHFIITRYMQELIEKKLRNNGLYLKTLTPAGNTERVAIANSSTDQNLRVTLLVTYTKL